MLIKSTYLDKEFEVEVTQLENGTIIIPHYWIEQLCVDNKVTFTVDALKISAGETIFRDSSTHEYGKNVFLGSMSDESGRTVIDIGESSVLNCFGKLSERYLTTMAFQRCYDRCAIKFFGLPPKVYSENEISNEEDNGEELHLNRNEAVQEMFANAGTPQYVQPAPQVQQYSQPAPQVQQYSQPAPQVQQYAQPAPQVQQYSGNPQYSQPAPNPQQYSGSSPYENPNQPLGENFVISFGNNKGKRMGDLSNNDLSWFVNSLKPTNNNGRNHRESAIIVLKNRGMNV